MSHSIKKTDYSISFIRLLSMLLIITCHILQFYDNIFAWVLNVGVQIFLIISGYLYGRKSINQSINQSIPSFIYKQCKKILVPYWVFLTIAIVTYYMFYPDYINTGVVLSSSLTIGTIKGIEHLWFIRYILLCYCLLPVLNFIRDRITGEKMMVFAAIVTMILSHLIFTMLPFFDGWFINCFIFGYFLSNIECRSKKITINYVYVAVIIIAIVVNAIRLMGVYDCVPTISDNICLSKYAHLLFGASLFILMHKYLRISKSYKILVLSDKYSFPIYLVHQYFILSPFTLMTLTNIPSINILLVYLVSCVSGYFLYKIYSPILKRI